MRLPFAARGLRVGGPLVFGVLNGSVSASIAAQESVTPRYRAEALACVSLRQSVISDIETVHGTDRRSETVSWEGDLILSATAEIGGALSVSAWFDQLAVWRTIPEGRLEPETAGMIGGRYRGTLQVDGAYRSTGTPFIPDAVAAIAALETALDELLPPVPNQLPEVGAVLTDVRGWQFERLSDSTTDAGPAWRWLLARSDTSVVAVDWGGGRVAEGESIEQETGRVVWLPLAGPLTWIRHITTTITFPPSTVSERPVRTSVSQDRRLSRAGPLEPGRCSTP